MQRIPDKKFMKNEKLNQVCRRAGAAIAEFGLIESGDRILIGLSGGKDSWVLCHVLHALQRKSPVKFELTAATFDPGYPELHTDAIAGYCSAAGWEYSRISMDIGSMLDEDKSGKIPCVMCSRLRRGRLYRLAREKGCNKLALGHHLDDIVTGLLMSMCRGHGAAPMRPKMRSETAEHITVIRPLCTSGEQLIAAAAEELDLPLSGGCPYKSRLQSGDREFFRGIVRLLEEHNPNLHSDILHSLFSSAACE